MRCWKCDREIADDARFCTYCGIEQAYSTTQTSAPPSGVGKGNAKQSASFSSIIGIDLGSVYSRAAVIRNGKPVLIPTAQGGRARPSAVGVKDGRILVCEQAQQPGVCQPSVSFKALMGSREELKLDGKSYLPQFFAALIMRKLRQDAEQFMGQKVFGAVVIVPNSYTCLQRQAVLEAGKIAGLEIKRLVSASAAAALAQGWQQQEEQAVLVCNLGRGTFDSSVVSLGNSLAEVASLNGDNTLGGRAFDACIARWLAEEFQRINGIDISSDAVAMDRLLEAAERAKAELSNVTVTHINIPYLTSGAQGVRHLDLTLSRAKFDELTAHLIIRASSLIKQAIEDSKDCFKESGLSGINKVLLVGGASRIPAFRDMVKEHAPQADFLGVQPDECAALGAAIQGGIISGDVRGVLLLDAISMALGIETAGGAFTPLITRNTTLLAKVSQEFSTIMDNQTSIDIHVLQGESEKASGNVSLGQYRFSGIPPAKKGVPRIEVIFAVDQNGMVNMQATDKGTGKKWMVDMTSRIKTAEDRIQIEACRAAEVVP